MDKAVAPWLHHISQQLTPSSETASLDSQVLLAHVLERSRAWVLAHPEARLTAEQERAIEEALARLKSGEPLPYVLGFWEFYGLDFAITPATLIPRPETELLVEVALNWLRLHPGRRRALDVGTGSGCIAVSLALNVPDLLVLASDICLPALGVAHENAQKHGLDGRVFCVQADLMPATREPFDLICANLPYIPSKQLRSLRVAGWEPRQALDGGPEGLELVGRLLRVAPFGMKAGAVLLLEIEASQGAPVCSLAQDAFPGAEVKILHDLAGCERVVQIKSAG